MDTGIFHVAEMINVSLFTLSSCDVDHMLMPRSLFSNPKGQYKNRIAFCVERTNR